jgi:hypothetical protein
VREGTIRQVVAFAAIFAVLTVGFEYLRGREPGPGAMIAVLLATAVYAAVMWLNERRKDEGD